MHGRVQRVKPVTNFSVFRNSTYLLGHSSISAFSYRGFQGSDSGYAGSLAKFLFDSQQNLFSYTN